MEPALVAFTAETVALERGMDPAELWTLCGDNTRRFFNAPAKGYNLPLPLTISNNLLYYHHCREASWPETIQDHTGALLSIPSRFPSILNSPPRHPNPEQDSINAKVFEG